MDFEPYPDRVAIDGIEFSAARKVKEGIVFVPYTVAPQLAVGDVINFYTSGFRHELRVLDFSSSASLNVGTAHNYVLELRVENNAVVLKRKEESQQVINIGTLNGQQVQVGNQNTQHVNITIEQLAKEVAKGDDKEAKGILKSLLENATVSSVIGAGVSGLIALL
ncbi:hypothetical protein PshuTeo1_14800 [Pseudomonas hunanensis]|nr:hypothetical protein PshuTeo1_14800 [Pseudomonas hunanensis]